MEKFEAKTSIKCDVCGEAKEINLLGRKMPVKCKCSRIDDIALDEAIASRGDKIKADMIDYIYSKSGIPEQKRNISFESSIFMPELKQAIEWLDGSEKNMFLYGDTGTGKTHMTYCILNKMIRDEFQCRIIDLFGIQDEYLSAQYNEKEKVMQSLKNHVILAIDDLGTEKLTDHLYQLAFKIINDRYSSGARMIVSTNYSPDRILSGDMKEKRLFRRILEDCKVIECKTQIIKPLEELKNEKNKFERGFNLSD